MDLIPSNFSLSALENSLTYAMSREYTLRNCLSSIKEDYDNILLDCQPSLGMLTINAHASANSVIIPVQSEYFVLRGMTDLFKIINKVSRQINPTLKIEGALLTLVDSRSNLPKEIVTQLKDNYGSILKLFNTQIPRAVKTAESTSTGRLVTIVVTDENGYLKSNAVLSWNDYYLQEIKPSDGYELDTTRYNVDIKVKEAASVDVVEKVIKNYVSILKQYEQVDGNTTFLNAEKGITFEIYYSNGNKYGEITTDKNGYASLKLPYGVWKFHQVNTTTGYEKIYDFYITGNK